MLDVIFSGVIILIVILSVVSYFHDDAAERNHQAVVRNNQAEQEWLQTLPPEKKEAFLQGKREEWQKRAEATAQKMPGGPVGGWNSNNGPGGKFGL